MTDQDSSISSKLPRHYILTSGPLIGVSLCYVAAESLRGLLKRKGLSKGDREAIGTYLMSLKPGSFEKFFSELDGE